MVRFSLLLNQLDNNVAGVALHSAVPMYQEKTGLFPIIELNFEVPPTYIPSKN